jgi:superfamily II DNA or RNA helicase/HKD family nuclease
MTDSKVEPLQPGLYESLLTTHLERQLAHADDVLADLGDVDPAEQPHVLARHIYEEATRALAGLRDTDSRLNLVNTLLTQLATVDRQVAPGPRQLLSVLPAGVGPERRATPVRPSTPLSDAALLTNAPGEPSLGAELKAEIATADQVDLLCAFVKWHGLRILETELGRLRRRHAPFRVITTTYMGASERAAIDRLVRDFGAEVKVQYDAERTRLHAKAWLFRRASGFDTGYVGSSNLSRAALLDGVEWNVRLSKVATGLLLNQFEIAFDTYWHDDAFEAYHPDDLDQRDRLDDALAEASGRRAHDRATISLSGLEVRPFPYQSRMLEDIAAERAVHDRHRNLVVAATGTGKTVVAALDYKRLAEQSSYGRPTLLFVAHRKEILTQSLRTYQEVLADASFGELYVDGLRPERGDHLFASVQSLASYGVTRIQPDRYDVIVIDEFHHAAAATYRAILDHLHPQELLGLTATPERADGVNVTSFFDGRTATGLRLWDALGQDLLCPFHYFGIADGVDLSQVAWKRGRYDEAQLAGLYTGNEARTRIVLKQLRDKVADVSAMRALGFCVSVDHARYMAEMFTRAGIPARSVVGTTSAGDRAQAVRDLRERRVNALFTADLFNEGVDVPEVDTVLFLRPTESATVFLQQLGRGLRRSRSKAVLSALDFVGHHRKEFRFDARYRALTGATRKGLEREVERGFPFLPSGCQIVLDRQTQENVLANIRAQISMRWPQLVTELRSRGDLPLPRFLEEAGLELADVVRGNRSWTRLRGEADLPTRGGSAHEAELLRRVRALAHVDDLDRAAAYLDLLADDAPRYDDLDEDERRFARMLFFSLWPDGRGFATYNEGFTALRRELAVRDELTAVIELAFDQTRHLALPMAGTLASSPLRVHARYQREEILTALDYARLEGTGGPQRLPNSMREGVMWSEAWQSDAFLITLQKSETDYSPTTMYRDYAISPTLFHWESQSVTSVASPTGQRYLTHTANGTHIMLFARQHKADVVGTAPYLFLGLASYVSHSGDRPIGITWRLHHPMPTEMFTEASVVAG